MKLMLVGKQMLLSDVFKEKVASTFSFLENALPGDKTVTVTVEAKAVTILFYFEQEVVKLTETGNDLYTVLPRLAKRVEKQLRQFRKMKRSLEKGRKNDAYPIAMHEEDFGASTELRISKRKRFEMKPMSEEEAILQMNASAHSQFIFANAEQEGRICLLYTRKDQSYGVIEASY